ncbi:MAG: hypothetical protein RLZZ436_1204 [Planctomycetota bacterium]
MSPDDGVQLVAKIICSGHFVNQMVRFTWRFLTEGLAQSISYARAFEADGRVPASSEVVKCRASTCEQIPDTQSTMVYQARPAWRTPGCPKSISGGVRPKMVSVRPGKPSVAPQVPFPRGKSKGPYPLGKRTAMPHVTSCHRRKNPAKAPQRPGPALYPQRIPLSMRLAPLHMFVFVQAAALRSAYEQAAELPSDVGITVSVEFSS